tara:strand:+ start:152 stop:436 length:285 start_codon:yes stop_codon:yes gene_type:complete
MLNQTNDFYKRLEKQLSDSSAWPSLYKFKFILKSDSGEITNLKKMFDDIDADISSNFSSSKNFTSITVTAKMKSAEDIIKKYKSASEIEGIISL